MTSTEPGPDRARSEDEAKLLSHEAFIAEVLQARRLDGEKKPRWRIFLESSAVTALVTVILGGWVGHVLTTSFQEKTKERELALARQKEVINARLETIKWALKDIGEVVSGSEDLIVLTRDSWNSEKFAGKAREHLEEQKTRMRASFNSSDAKWRKDRETLGLLLAYYSTDRPEIVTSWDQAQAAVNQFIQCAQARHQQSLSQQKVADECEKARIPVSAALQSLVAKLSSGLAAGPPLQPRSSP